MGVTVQWEGLDAWISLVVGMKQTTPEKAKEIMGEIGESAKSVMDAHTPVRSGELKAGNTLTETVQGFDLSNAVDHAIFVEKGTRRMRAQPFLEPATEYAAQEMDARLPQALEAS